MKLNRNDYYRPSVGRAILPTRTRFRGGVPSSASRLERRPHTGRCRKPGGLPINVRGSGNREGQIGRRRRIKKPSGRKKLAVRKVPGVAILARPGPAPLRRAVGLRGSSGVDAATEGLIRDDARPLALRSIVGGQVMDTPSPQLPENPAQTRYPPALPLLCHWFSRGSFSFAAALR